MVVQKTSVFPASGETVFENLRKPETLQYENFLDFAITAHIDVSDVVGETATCKRSNYQSY